MSNSTLKNNQKTSNEPKGFGQIVKYTPVHDHLIQEFDYRVALVYGRVWRFCQGEWGYCGASRDRIRKELRMSKNTVDEALKKLVIAGYLRRDPPLGQHGNEPISYYLSEPTELIDELTTAVEVSISKEGHTKIGTPQLPKIGTLSIPKEGHKETIKKEQKKEDVVASPEKIERKLPSMIPNENDPKWKDVRFETEMLDFGVSKDFAAEVVMKPESYPGAALFLGWCMHNRKGAGYFRKCLENGWQKDKLKELRFPKKKPDDRNNRCPDCGNHSSSCLCKWGYDERAKYGLGEL